MNPIEEAIAVMGSAKALADLLEIKPGTVRVWRNRGGIPRAYAASVLRAIAARPNAAPEPAHEAAPPAETPSAAPEPARAGLGARAPRAKVARSRSEHAPSREQAREITRGFQAAIEGEHVDHRSTPGAYAWVRDQWLAAAGLDRELIELDGTGLSLLLISPAAVAVGVVSGIEWSTPAGLRYVLCAGTAAPGLVEGVKGVEWLAGPQPGPRVRPGSLHVRERALETVEGIERTLRYQAAQGLQRTVDAHRKAR